MSNPQHPHSYSPYTVPPHNARTAAASVSAEHDALSDAFENSPQQNAEEARRREYESFHPPQSSYQPVYDSNPYPAQSPPHYRPHHDAPYQQTPPFFEQGGPVTTDYGLSQTRSTMGGGAGGSYGGGTGAYRHSNLPVDQSQFNLTPIASTSLISQMPQQPQQRYYSAPTPRQTQRPRALSDTTPRPPPNPYRGPATIPLISGPVERGTGVGRGRGQRVTARNSNWRARGGFSGQDFDAKVPLQSKPLSPLSHEDFIAASRKRQALSNFLSSSEPDQQGSASTLGSGGLFPLTSSLLPDSQLLDPASSQSFQSSVSSTSDGFTNYPYPTPKASTIGLGGFDSGNIFDYEGFAASGSQSDIEGEEEQEDDKDWVMEGKLPGEGRFPVGPGAKRANVNGSKALAEGIVDPLSGLTDKSCKRCRTRKVKCDRVWPRCSKCKERGEECNFGGLIPVAAIKKVISDTGDDIVFNDFAARLTSVENILEALKATATILPAVGGQEATTTTTTALVLSDAIRQAFVLGSTCSDKTYRFIESCVEALNRGVSPNVGLSGVLNGLGLGEFGKMGGSHTGSEDIGETALGWRLARGALAKALSLHLVDSFFVSCCAYLPVFQPWHEKVDYLRANLDKLGPADQVAVSAFCAMGARASPHSALLGVPVPSPDESPSGAASTVAGTRRETACRAIHKQTLDLCHELEIAHDPSVINLEALLVKMQMLIFNEVLPRKSRSLVRLALGQFKDLQDSAMPDDEKASYIWRLGLPLAYGDAVTAAYSRKPPLISPSDLTRYFEASPLRFPDFSRDNLSAILNPLLAPEDGEGKITHENFVDTTTHLATWLAAAQRQTANISTHGAYQNHQLPSQIRQVWSAIDQIHESIQRLQQVLVNLSYPPAGCGQDGCSDLHLRFDTRLDRDVMDVTYLLHLLVGERKATIDRGDAEMQRAWAFLWEESDRRVRKSLKLTAFYSQLYITSHDRHMVYHVFFQLELLPKWTQIVLQKVGDFEGPSSPDLQISKTELDWFEQGLMVASFYHPVANKRLEELREGRKGGDESSNAAGPNPEEMKTSLRADSRLKDFDGKGLSFPRAIVRLASDRKSLAEKHIIVESVNDPRLESPGADKRGVDEDRREDEGWREKSGTISEEQEEDSPMDQWLSSEGSHALL